MNEERLRRREELRRKNKKVKKSRDIISILLTLFIICGIGILSYGYYLTTPVDKVNKNKVTLEIKESYGASAVSDLLYKNNLIRSPFVFKVYSKLTSNSEFYVGQYQVSKDMSLSQILKVLTSKEQGKSGITLTIIDGENIEKIAEKVEQVTDISATDFKNKVNDQEFINKLKVEFPNLITNDLDDSKLKYKLEGYLYPAGYDIDNSNISNAEALIKMMISATNNNIVPLYNQNPRVWNINGQDTSITIHQYITMASILEKESTSTADNGSIAGVFMNRLKINMPLQTDPSVSYSLGRSGDLSFEDLKNTDLFNTYVHPGLTPGPIAAASKTSYDALNNIVSHDYLYFLTDKSGKAHFAKTFEEHEKLAREHIPGYVSTN